MNNTISIINKTKGKLPSLPFALLKQDILGIKYSLSIAFVGEITSKKLNYKFRQKNKSTNILSFELEKNSGELVLCPAVIKREYKNFDRTLSDFTGYLVIHGMLHLKGMAHGSIMDKAENKYEQKYFHRHRPGLEHNTSSGSRNSKKGKLS